MQSIISEQVFKRFGHCQNRQNLTLKRPYLLEKSRYENNFYTKWSTILLLLMYQLFIFLLGHLPFFLHFFFTFMGYFFWESLYCITFFTKRNTILLLYVRQVFIFLQDHLHFFLHFFFTFMEQLFLDDPIQGVSLQLTYEKTIFLCS